MTIKIGINGLGRIGRMVLRSIIESKDKKIEIKHNVIPSIPNLGTNARNLFSDSLLLKGRSCFLYCAT